ncbi:MAG: hypothetical protein IKP07_06275 [Bacilli bacterium]|nr:hypothetical protein [Bacilli bacterium]
MKRSFIYILVIVLTIGFVLSKYYIQNDLENVPIEAIEEFESGKYIQDDLDTFKEIIDSESIKSSLTIENKQNDTEKVKYDYVLKVSETKGSYLYKIGDDESYLIFDATGTAKFNLFSNETITIYNLPLDSTYKVEQVENSKYKTKVGDETTLVGEGNIFIDSKVTFNNISISSKEYTPDTADGIKLIMMLLIIASLSIMFLTRLKVQRFTTE